MYIYIVFSFLIVRVVQFVVKALLTSLNDDHYQIHENVLENNMTNWLVIGDLH